METVLPRSTGTFVFLLSVLVIPPAVYAQATIAGVVTDRSGVALPGVTVEAQRAGVRQTAEVVTDSKGRYKIGNLRPGIYTISFKLIGFQFLRHEGVEVINGDTTTVDAVGSIDANCVGTPSRPCGATVIVDPTDYGCGHAPAGGKCLTYKQVAVDVPHEFRPLWDSSVRDAEAVRAGFPCDSISLRQSGGMMFVPGYNYTVALFQDGHAELTSKDLPDKDANYTGTVNFWDYGKLCYLIQRQGFDRFARYYSANWTDAGGMTITVTSSGRQVAVSEYSGIGPIELWAIENAIDAVKKRIEWKPR